MDLLPPLREYQGITWIGGEPDGHCKVCGHHECSCAPKYGMPPKYGMLESAFARISSLLAAELQVESARGKPESTEPAPFYVGDRVKCVTGFRGLGPKEGSVYTVTRAMPHVSGVWRVELEGVEGEWSAKRFVIHRG